VTVFAGDGMPQMLFSAVGATAISASIGVEAITNSIDPSDIAGWVFGILGTGSVVWKVLSDRAVTVRTDKVLMSALDDMTEDRDYWRGRADLRGDDRRVDTRRAKLWQADLED
jgi:hypothetical protein